MYCKWHTSLSMWNSKIILISPYTCAPHSGETVPMPVNSNLTFVCPPPLVFLQDRFLPFPRLTLTCQESNGQMPDERVWPECVTRKNKKMKKLCWQ